MKKYLQIAARNLQSNKFIAIFAVTMAVTVASSVAVVGASSQNYLSIEKPGDISICDGGSWRTVHRWSWFRRHRHQVWVANWEKLGFDSKRQCVRYVSTPAPTSKSECRTKWWSLGFTGRRACYSYLRQHSGGGYDGRHDYDHHDW